MLRHTAALALLLSACASGATITLAFQAALQTGGQAGISFSGTLAYNNSTITGVGTEYISLTALDFSVFGETFNRAGISQGGQIILVNGVPSYFTAAYFPSIGPVNDLAFGFGGPGIIGYSTPPGFNFGAGMYAFVTPEPSLLLPVGVAALLLLSCRTSRVNQRPSTPLPHCEHTRSRRRA